MSHTLSKKACASLAALVVGLSTVAGTSFAAEFYLMADTMTKTMPDGALIPMWGFVLTDENFDPLPGEEVTVPGPRLEVPPGNLTLTVHLKNNLPEPVSIVIAGQLAAMPPVKFTDAQGRQRIRSFTYETAPGASGTYTWTGFRPGTYLYHSGTHPAVQVQMGLYGAVTKDAAAEKAYRGKRFLYDSEVVLFYSEIDPALHQAVDDGTYGTPPMTSTIDYDPKYFLINGEPYSDGAPGLPTVQPNDRVLVRSLNAGLETHAPVLLGLHMSVIAEDGKVYPYAREQYSLMLPAGQTKDAIVIPSTAGSYPVYDHRMNLTNAGASLPGGMLTYLNVAAPAALPTSDTRAMSELP